MITPITHEGIMRTRQKINMHVKAGEGDLLMFKPTNNNREERMSVLLSGIGSHIINHHYSINQSNDVKYKRSLKKVDDCFEKIMSNLFDKEHELKDN